MAKHVIHYQNNPFYIGLNGLQLLFKKAQQVAIYAAVLVGLGVLGGTTANIIDSVNKVNDPESYNVSTDTKTIDIKPSNVDVAVVLIIASVVLGISVVIMLVSLYLYGVLEYTGAHLALGENVELKDALLASLKNLPGYFWVYVIMIVKVFLWTLLLIVPGIIMSVRYSLAGTVFFAEHKRGNTAVKRSAELTKGAWFTTFAGTGLWNLITFGQISWLVTPSANAILYRQLKATTDSGAKKPSAHWLSWLTFFGPIVLLLIFIAFVILFVTALWVAFKG